MLRRSRVPELASALVFATGCKCAPDRPYTPFHIEPSASVSAAALPSPAASAPASDAYPREATVVQNGPSKFDVDGVPIDVGAERAIDRALAADFDGDGTRDAVAWTRHKTEPADAPDTGELLFFGGKSPAGRVVASLPPFVPSGPTCKKTVTLVQSGPRTVALDVSSHCETPLVPRSPTRGIAVVSPASERPVVALLRLADAAPGETLGVTVDSRDRDGDGRDDVRATVTLRTDPNGPMATADLVWLDRTAGPSRDRSEPAHSLAAIASPEAKAAALAAKVPLAIDQARRLYATLCAESGTARVFDADGEALPCPDAGAALATLLEAEVRAAIRDKDLLSAVGALSRNGWYEAPLPEKARTALEKDIAQASDRRGTTELVVDVAARSPTGLPRFGPLAFDATGALLVETTDGVARVTLPEGKVEEASGAVDPWPLTVGGAGTPRWTGIAFPCDAPEVVLLESDAAGTPLPSQKTRILAPRPGPCRHGGTIPAPEVAPLEWAPGRMAGLISGGLFGVESVRLLASEPPQPGTPRSPDGKSLVVPWSKGFLVLGAGKPATWNATPVALSDCTISNGATAVACVRSDKVAVFTPDKPKKTGKEK